MQAVSQWRTTDLRRAVRVPIHTRVSGGQRGGRTALDARSARRAAGRVPARPRGREGAAQTRRATADCAGLRPEFHPPGAYQRPVDHGCQHVGLGIAPTIGHGRSRQPAGCAR